MSRLTDFFDKFQSLCEDKSIPVNVIWEDDSTIGVLVLKKDKPRAQHFTAQLVEDTRKHSVHLKTRTVDNGILFMMSTAVLDEDKLSAAMFECNTKYNDFTMRLDEALTGPLDEDQMRGPTRAITRGHATEPFPDQFSPEKVKKRKKKTIDDKIDEAFEGMATPDDVQPGEVVQALMGALKDSGLGADLKKAGIGMHVAEPGQHAITFSKGDTPIIQVSTISLSEPKDFGELLSHLRSVANGQAPQAGLIELDMLQQQAKDASAKKSQLDDIASQYTASVNPKQKELAAQQANAVQ